MGRVPGLDGLRGIAILLVMGFHLGLAVLPSGSYGVTVFFVLSGFLITLILMERPRLRDFYLRRAIRLLPPLVIVIAFYLALGGAWSNAWPPLAYVANYVRLERDLYPLGHTWSLAVEEHFYLVWPLIVLLAKRRRVEIFGGFLIAAVLWRVMRFDDGFMVVYRSTDTNAAALLAGSWWASVHVERPLTPTRFDVLAVLGLVALAVFVPRGGSAYLWLEFAVIGLTLVAIRSALAPSIIDVRWLRGMGIVSYGVYLWHVPLMAMMSPLGGVLLAVPVAAAMWVWVESPLLKKHRELRQPKAPSLGRVVSSPSEEVMISRHQFQFRPTRSLPRTAPPHSDVGPLPKKDNL